MLTSADVDAVAGLLHLREFQPLHVYATQSVRRILHEENRIFRVLERADPPVVWHDVPLNTWLPLGLQSSHAKEDPPARFRYVPLGSTYPDYVSAELRRILPSAEAVVGIAIEQGSRRFFCAPAIPGRSGEYKEWAQWSDLCLVEGTFWDDNELISTGVGTKTAREIGHMPLSGAGGLLEELASATRGRRILVHINNTNPILDEESNEYREVRDAGWEIAYDGMELEL